MAGVRPSNRKPTNAEKVTASRLTIGLLFGSFARSGYRVNKVCKEKRLVTVPLLIRSNYSRVLKERVETFDSPLTTRENTSIPS